MNEPALKRADAMRLRVAVFASPLQKARWRRLLALAGHSVVDADGADAILAEGEGEVDAKCPLVRFGPGNSRAHGRLSGSATAEQIDAALRAVVSGLLVASPGLAEKGFRQAPDLSEKALLTARELEVLAAIAEGLTNKAIARRLDISLHTVKFHVESVFRKLGVRTRSEATARALERIREDTITI